MKKRILTFFVLFSLVNNIFADQPEAIIKLKTKTGTLEGSLLVPKGQTGIPVALIIAGSGPTDRDGNNPAMKNNSLKMLAKGLLNHDVSTLRYDKRGIAKSKNAGLKESDLRFEHYIEDAKAWVNLLKKDKRFSQVIVIGHSEGSLIGMIASQDKNVDKFVSLAGAGLSADKLLKKQLKAQSSFLLKISTPIIVKLVLGETVKVYNPLLYSLFRESVQPYMISWFQYDPAKEIAKLNKPILIIQGSTDIQVSVEDATILANASPKAKKKIIEGMNHIFKDVEMDRSKNIQTYNQPTLPIKSELIKIIVDFITSV